MMYRREIQDGRSEIERIRWPIGSGPQVLRTVFHFDQQFGRSSAGLIIAKVLSSVWRV